MTVKIVDTIPLAESRLTRIYFLARLSVGVVWIYQGLIPKIIFRDWSEIILLRKAGVDIYLIPALLKTFGYAEIIFGILVLTSWRSKWPLWGTVGAMIGGLLAVAGQSPEVLHAAFNPFTLNGLLAVMAVIALLAQPPPKTADH